MPVMTKAQVLAISFQPMSVSTAQIALNDPVDVALGLPIGTPEIAANVPWPASFPDQLDIKYTLVETLVYPTDLPTNKLPLNPNPQYTSFRLGGLYSAGACRYWYRCKIRGFPDYEEGFPMTDLT